MSAPLLQWVCLLSNLGIFFMVHISQLVPYWVHCFESNRYSHKLILYFLCPFPRIFHTTVTLRIIVLSSLVNICNVQSHPSNKSHRVNVVNSVNILLVRITPPQVLVVHTKSYYPSLSITCNSLRLLATFAFAHRHQCTLIKQQLHYYFTCINEPWTKEAVIT